MCALGGHWSGSRASCKALEAWSDLPEASSLLTACAPRSQGSCPRCRAVCLLWGTVPVSLPCVPLPGPLLPLCSVLGYSAWTTLLISPRCSPLSSLSGAPPPPPAQATSLHLAPRPRHPSLSPGPTNKGVHSHLPHRACHRGMLLLLVTLCVEGVRVAGPLRPSHCHLMPVLCNPQSLLPPWSP